MLPILKESRLFRECTDPEFHEIANIVQKMSIKEGECIFEAKTMATHLYVVSEGAVELRFTVDHYNVPREITLDRKARGEVFGWSALTKPNVYTLTALATQDSELLRVNGKDLKALCAKNDHLGYAVMKNIAEIIGERFELVQNILMNEIQQNLRQREV